MSLPKTLSEAREKAGVRTARLDGGVTAYHVHGDRGPWVVLVHGIMTPMYAWEPLANALATAGFRVLRYDQLGRGLSDRPKVRYDPALYVRQLRALTSELGIDTAHVVSWSMGAVISSRLALEAPDFVQRHVLIAPGLFLPPPLRIRILSRLPFARAIIARRASAFLDELPAEHLSHPERMPRYGERMREQLEYPGLGQSFASSVLNYAWHAGPEFRRVGEHPRAVLLVWGDKDEATPYANAARVREIYPRAELITLPGAKHAPHVEHEALVNGHSVRFLKRGAEARDAKDEQIAR
jgi:pimeloyl-ACP methyl ester carboxylesterase